MVVDRSKLIQVFEDLGKRLAKPATICLIGSAPGIASGQPDRQSQGIDVWRGKSHFDETDFRAACTDLGLLYDPKDELTPDAVYVQIVRPGVVRLPRDFDVEVLAQYGNLSVVMPPAALLSAERLVRGDVRDIEDVAWWVKDRALDLDEIRTAITTLPDALQREKAIDNIVFVDLIVAPGRCTWENAEVSRTARTLYVTALDALLKGQMAEVAFSRDVELLREVARLAQQDAPAALSSTDPALFIAWRNAVTKFHLKGWTHMTPERVDAVSERLRARR